MLPKPKFYYADFATKFVTKSADVRAPRSQLSPKLPRGLCCLFFLADFFRVLPQTKFHYSDTNIFVSDLLQTLSQPSRPATFNFHGPHPQLSPKLPHGEVLVKVGIMGFGLKAAEIDLLIPFIIDERFYCLV